MDHLPEKDEAFETETSTFYAPTAHGREEEALGADLPQWALIRYVGHPIGEVVKLGLTELVAGRSPSSALYLPEPEVSRRHARILLDRPGDPGAQALVEDLGSTNGTFVNGHRIPPGSALPLRDGDMVRVGSHAFKLKRLDGVEQRYHQAMQAQSTLDALTGVHNRASVLNFLEKNTDLSRRYGRRLSVILCDLDHFKDVNDTYGHPCGDQVLRIFGALLLGRLRSSDMVGRIGGEEFLVVLPETPGPEAASVAEDLRRSLEAEPVSPPGGGELLRVTSCFGVTELQEGDPDGGTLLARADVALYRAKTRGRNRVECDVCP